MKLPRPSGKVLAVNMALGALCVVPVVIMAQTQSSSAAPAQLSGQAQAAAAAGHGANILAKIIEVRSAGERALTGRGKGATRRAVWCPHVQ